MPTAAEFDALARRFEDAAAELATVVPPLAAAFGPAVLQGGVLTADVQITVEGVGRQAGAIGGQLLDDGAECRRRAEQCRQLTAEWTAYRAAMAAYQSELAAWRRAAAAPPAGSGADALAPPAAPGAPSPPPSWATLG